MNLDYKKTEFDFILSESNSVFPKLCLDLSVVPFPLFETFPITFYKVFEPFVITVFIRYPVVLVGLVAVLAVFKSHHLAYLSLYLFCVSCLVAQILKGGQCLDALFILSVLHALLYCAYCKIVVSEAV